MNYTSDTLEPQYKITIEFFNTMSPDILLVHCKNPKSFSYITELNPTLKLEIFTHRNDEFFFTYIFISSRTPIFGMSKGIQHISFWGILSFADVFFMRYAFFYSMNSKKKMILLPLLPSWLIQRSHGVECLIPELMIFIRVNPILLL